jgi:hypothetical protein
MVTLATALMTGGTLMDSSAQTAQIGAPGEIRVADNFQLYLYGGRHYCWYDDGWQGSGWYWHGAEATAGVAAMAAITSALTHSCDCI